MKLQQIFLTMLIIFAMSTVVLATPFTDGLREGENKHYDLGERSYDVLALYVSQEHAMLSVNNELTDYLVIGDDYILKDGSTIHVSSIKASDRKKLVNFAISYCGDAICNGNEICSTCQQDCGCPEGEICVYDYCTTQEEATCTDGSCGEKTLFEKFFSFFGIE